MTDAPYRRGQEITDGVVYRRIPNRPTFYDHEQHRPTSQTFRRDAQEPYVSMSLASLCTMDEVMAGDEHRDFGLCSLPVSSLIALGLTVTYEPDYGYAHVGVWNVTKSKCSMLAHLARVLIPPPIRSD